MNNVPLINNLSVNDINTALIAIKRQLLSKNGTQTQDVDVNVDVNIAQNSLYCAANSTTIKGAELFQGCSIKVLFTSAITGSNTTSPLTINYNNVDITVKVGKNGALADFVAYNTGNDYVYCQAYTTLELLFDGNNFVIMGNPVVISNSDYTVYTDGSITYTRSGTQKQINNHIYKTYGQFGLSFDEVVNYMQLSYPLRLRIKFCSQDLNYFINMNVYKESATDNPMALYTANTSGTNVNYNPSIVVPRYGTNVLAGHYIVESYV